MGRTPNTFYDLEIRVYVRKVSTRKRNTGNEPRCMSQRTNPRRDTESEVVFVTV